MLAWLALAPASLAGTVVVLPGGAVAAVGDRAVVVIDAGTGALRYTVPTSGGHPVDLSVVDGKLVVWEGGVATTWDGTRRVTSSPAPTPTFARPTCLPFAGGLACDGTPRADPPRTGDSPRECCADCEPDLSEDCYATLRRDGEADDWLPGCHVVAASASAILLEGRRALTLADTEGRILVRTEARSGADYAMGEGFAVVFEGDHVWRMGEDGSVKVWRIPPETLDLE